MLSSLRRRIHGLFRRRRRAPAAMSAKPAVGLDGLHGVDGAGNGMSVRRIVPNTLVWNQNAGQDDVHPDRAAWLKTMDEWTKHGVAFTGDVHGEMAWFDFSWWERCAKHRGVAVRDLLEEFRQNAGLTSLASHPGAAIAV